MRTIMLTKGFEAIVDDDIYTWAMQWKWHITMERERPTRVARKPRKSGRTGVPTLSLAREITQAPRHLCVDHINGNILDNRRENLRLCSRGNNAINRKPYPLGKFKKHSKYKGVTRKKDQSNKWIAVIYPKNKRITIGSFSSENEAANAYNQAAVKFFGEFARLNTVSL